jgi:nucleotide-binding universal stress UspA family protein
MKRFKNILYVVSDDEDVELHTAARVQALARRNDAQVCVVDILEKNVVDQLGSLILNGEKKLSTLARKQLKEELESFTAHESWKGITVTTEVLEGKDFIEIIQKVLKDEHDLVIKRGVEEDGSDQLAMRLFRKCPCPVWIIRNSKTGGFKRILAALDLGNRKEENRQLNRKIIELTDSMAKLEGAEAHYIHVLYLEFEGMMRGPRFSLSDEEISGLKQELKEQSEKTLGQLFQEIGVQAKQENIHLVGGETSETIKTIIKDLSIDVLVMGTVARSGVPGLLIGNKAEKVLSAVDCTVLAVKPGGYVSPVK